MTGEAFKNFILSLTVAFPAIVGVIRFRRIDSTYRPFLIYVFVSLLVELIQGLIIIPNTKKGMVIGWNLFNLFEAIILLFQFYHWINFNRYKKIFPILIGITFLGWLIENLFINNIYHFNAIFLISYSFILVLLSVQTINFSIVNENRQPLTRNATFIICTGLIVFFIYDIFVWTLIAEGIKDTNKKLIIQVFAIQVYINAFVNILYGIAVCFMQKKISGKDLFRDLHI
jgi:hypothetical protein